MNKSGEGSVAVLLINTGSPDSPKITHVGSYLSRFLGNQRIISLPWLFRILLVNGIIVPFRSWKSSKRYLSLWNHVEKTFPLPHYGATTQQLLQSSLGKEATIFLGMCYGKPTIKKCVDQIINQGFSRLIIIPLFPQYASSSTGVALELTMNRLKKYSRIPEIITINSFYNHPLFIKAFAKEIHSYQPKDYDYVLFTYHSLPTDHIREACPLHQSGNNSRSDYCNSNFCYVRACYQTTKLIRKSLNLPENMVGTAFQSQLSNNWLEPFADELITKKAKEGVKSLLVVAPSFVADCLETTVELGEEYKQLFLSHGGEKYNLVNSLNDSPIWIEMLQSLCQVRLHPSSPL